MKKAITSLAFIFSLGLIISCGTSESKASSDMEVIEGKKTEVLAENKEAVDMKVEGMVCAMGCAKYIEDKVADLDGVTLSTVDYEKGTAHFEFDKTVTNSKELEKFIVEIHEGQYKAQIISAEELKQIEENDAEEESVSSENNSGEEVVSVSERFQFSIPDLFGILLNSIR